MRPSKIDRLPAEVRDFIARKRAEGRTAEEIRADCRKAFPSIPAAAWPTRSRFGHHVRRLDQIAKKIELPLGIAETLMRRVEIAVERGHAPKPRGGDAPPAYYRCTFVMQGVPNIRGVMLVPVETDGTERAPVRCEFPAEIVRRLRVGRFYRLSVVEIEPPVVIETEGATGPTPWRPGAPKTL